MLRDAQTPRTVGSASECRNHGHETKCILELNRQYATSGIRSIGRLFTLQIRAHPSASGSDAQSSRWISNSTWSICDLEHVWSTWRHACSSFSSSYMCHVFWHRFEGSFAMHIYVIKCDTNIIDRSTVTFRRTPHDLIFGAPMGAWNCISFE